MVMDFSFIKRWVKVMFSLLFLHVGFPVYAQMLSSDPIWSEFVSMGIDILQPLDGNFKIEAGNMDDDLFPHQMVIVEKDYKILIQLKTAEEMKVNIPHIFYSNLMHTLASNEAQDDEHVFIYKLPPVEGIDWQSECRFMPKNQLSQVDFGILKSYYVEDKFFLSILILDNDLKPKYQDPVSFTWLYDRKNNLK